MSRALRDDIKQQVQSATDIVHLIGEQVALKAKGREFVGLCPFHDDRKPSMTVSPAKQIFHCFACGTGGDVFGFVMKFHRMSFPEALRHLADRAGIKLTPQTREAHKAPDERQRIRTANELGLSFFQALLRHPEHGSRARKYLQDRSISQDMVEQFQLGYAPDRWDGLARMIADKGWDARAFELAGLVAARDSGGQYDKLRHRLIFPICDALGRPIAFGGRTLPNPSVENNADAKYLNSPETPLFNKSATLYGLHLALRPIISSRVAIIVEGYVDVIACHQAGVRNVVAALGTAFTTQHLQQLRNRADKVVLVFDGDEAGHKAADRAVEVFLTQSFDVEVAVLPEGLDPADLFNLPDGLAKWEASMAAAKDALSYQLDRVQEQLTSQDTVTGRQRIAEEYLRKLVGFGLQKVGTIRRGFVMQRLSQMLHLSEEAIAGMLRDLAPAPQRAQGMAAGANPASLGEQASEVSTPAGPTPPAITLAERMLLGCLLRQPGLYHRSLSDGHSLDEAIVASDFTSEAASRLYALIGDRLALGEAVSLHDVLSALADDQALANYATQAEVEVDQCLQGLEARVLTQLCIDAAETIRRRRRDQEYRQSQDQHREAPAEDQSLRLRQVYEHNRANPSPLRFPLKRR